MLFGAAFNTLSVFLFAIFSHISILLISIFFMALANSFESGAIEAWLTDYLISIGKKNSLSKKMTNRYSVHLIGTIIGAFIMGVLYEHNPKVPFLISTALFFISFGIVFILTENGIATEIRNTNLLCIENIKGIKLIIQNSCGYIVSTNYLIVFSFSIIFYSWGLDGVERFYQSYLNLLHFEPFLISSVYVFSSAVGLIILLFQSKFSAGHNNELSYLILIKTIMVVIIFAATLLDSYPAYILIVFFLGLTKTTSPLVQSYLNRNITTNNRATILSFFELVGSFGEVIAGVSIGYCIRLVNIVFGIQTSGLMILLSILCIWATIIVTTRKKATENRPKVSKIADQKTG